MKPLEESLREWLQRRAKHYCDPSTGMSERNLGKAELCTEVINKIDALLSQAPADTPPNSAERRNRDRQQEAESVVNFGTGGLL